MENVKDIMNEISDHRSDDSNEGYREMQVLR
jgi:hypothetical protein